MDPDQWCLFEAEAVNVSQYDVRSSNPVEQEFSRLTTPRELPLYELFDQAVKFPGELFARGKERCHVESLYPHPTSDAILSTPSTSSVYRYTSTTSGSTTELRFQCDLDRKWCLCLEWQQLGYPCEHTVRLAKKVNRFHGRE